MPEGHEAFIHAICRCLEAVDTDSERIDVHPSMQGKKKKKKNKPPTYPPTRVHPSL